jgi:hypothetical protein
MSHVRWEELFLVAAYVLFPIPFHISVVIPGKLAIASVTRNPRIFEGRMACAVLGAGFHRHDSKRPDEVN